MKALAMNPLRHSLLMLSAVLAISGCATTKTSGGVEVSGPSVAKSGPGEKTGDHTPQINARAKLLFEDALKATAAQKKAGKPDYASLEHKFQAAVEADPALAEADYNLGVLAERQGKKPEAIAHYKEALRKKPTLKEAAENLAVMSQNSGDEEGAVRIYQNILENYPEDASSRARMAEIYRRRGDHEKAMELARAALFREPRTLPAYKVMMQSYLDQKQLSMARLVALRAVKLDENDPEIYYTLGQVLLAENEPAKARLQFKKAVEKRPDYLPAHKILAKMALQQEDYAGAEQSLRRLLQASGNSAEAHLDLGVAYKGMGQYDKALVEYDTAQKLNPELSGVFLNRGIILAIKGMPEKAIEQYKLHNARPGAETNVSDDLIKESEAVLARREEDKRAAAEAAKMEAEAKTQEAAVKAEEKKVKEQELQQQIHNAKAPPADTKKGCLEKAKTPKERKACDKPTDAAVSGSAGAGKAPEVTPVAAPVEKKKAEPAPAKGTAKSGEPSDEPGDGL